MDMINLFTNLLQGSLTSGDLVDLAFIIIGVALILIIISAIILFLVNKKSREEKTAQSILKNISLIRNGKIKNIDLKKEELQKDKVENIKTKEPLQIKETEISLKQLLIKKFQPKVESQLHTKIKILDFNAKKNNFVAKINVQGHDLEIELDSSGKIIDYKNLD
ncbi:MAG: hypothetical protein WC915_04705 [archaeon]|jgi:hypothetical protein